MADPHIGTLAEKSLHAALKAWYARPGDQFEVRVDGYVIDIVRGEQLIEIQTRNFSAIKRKLAHLLDHHPVHLAHPIPAARWIVRVGSDGITVRTRRKSPLRGTVYDLFAELVRIPALINHPHFSVETLLVHEEVVLADDGQGSWRRNGWSVVDRRLLDVIEQRVFSSAADVLALLPVSLPATFTNRDLADALDERVAVAGKLTYCLRQMGALHVVGKRRNSHLFAVSADPLA